MAAAIDSIVATLVPVEVLVVSGFWRSGTTWIQEVACAAWGGKSVFEPLADETNSPLQRVLRDANLSLANRSAFIPLDMHQLDDASIEYLKGTISGKFGSPFSMYCRERILESVRTNVVFKEVRLQGILRRFMQWHQGKCIHVWRNPEHVVESLVNLKWSWTFSDVSLQSLQSAHEQLKPSSGSRLEEILKFDSSAVERAAALWALSERWVSDVAREMPDRVVIVRYEDLVATRSGEAIHAVLNDLGYKTVQAGGGDTISRSSNEFAGVKSVRSPLSVKDRDTVRRVVGAIFPERLGMLQ